MSQSKSLYESAHVWDQDLQLGQKNVIQAIADFTPVEVETVLDVGCGDGKITSAVIQALNRPVVGLDFSEEALSRCDFQTIRGDASQLPYGDKTVDMVMTTDTFEHLPVDLEARAWEQLFRVARNWVAITVPFREHLLDAAIKCHGCGHVYHANWHVRTYDWRELCARAPEGWHAEAAVLTGEAWPPYHPIETELRRKVLDEWSGWIDAVCPECGEAGDQPTSPSLLSADMAEMLGSVIYNEMVVRPLERQYSEVLCFFKADDCAQSLKTVQPAQFCQAALNQLDLQHAGRHKNLIPYPEHPRAVTGEKASLIVQLPMYGNQTGVRLRSGTEAAQTFTVTVEDGAGQMLSTEIELDGGTETTLSFSREARRGYYGLLVRLPGDVELSAVEVEEENPRQIIQCTPSGGVSYHQLNIDDYVVYTQVIGAVWLDSQALERPFVGATQETLDREKHLVDASLMRVVFHGLEGRARNVVPTDDVCVKKVTDELDSLKASIQGLVSKVEEISVAQAHLLSKREEVNTAEADDLIEAVISEYDVVDERARVVMLCHDQHLDRRVLAQAQSLIAEGCKVTLFALSYTAEREESITPEGIRLIRIGLNQIIPTNPTYLAYAKRQNRLNSILNACCNNLGIANFVWRRIFRVAHRMNWISYRAALLLRYRNRHIADPLPFTTAFKKAGAEVGADLIQVHDLPTLEAGVQLAADKHVPLVYDAHELYPEQRSFSKVQTRICAEAEARLIKHADLVFAVNESIGLEMAKRYDIPQPITMLNALDPLPDFDPTYKYDLLREKTGQTPDRKILLYQGGFSPNRNLETLIAAMALVKNPLIDLVMLGFGDFGAVLRKKAAKHGLLDQRVFFLNAVPPSELVQHSASADLGIIPYPHVDLNSYYCTPNKLFEFMQAGLPMIANESPELRRFVHETGFGLTRPMRNAKEMAAAIEEAFASEDCLIWRSSLQQKRGDFSWLMQSMAYVNAISPFLVRKS